MSTRELIAGAADLACTLVVLWALVLATRPASSADLYDAREAGYDDGYKFGYRMGREHAEHTLIRDHGE